MANRFMQRAIELARAGLRSGLGGPFGAVVVRGDAIIGEGANAVTSQNDPTAHAEVLAIRDACRRLGAFHLAGCEIYTTCEPCPMCLGAIYWARVARVYYGATREDAARSGFDDEFLYLEVARPRGERRIPLRPLMREEALAAFREWDALPEKVLY